MKTKIDRSTFNRMIKFFELYRIILIDEGESTLTNIQEIDEEWLFEELNNYLREKA